jgi:hypothetical protein
MAPKRLYSFMIDQELWEALKVAKDRSTELSEAGIIREALRDWFKKHGVKVKSSERRAGTRKRL